MDAWDERWDGGGRGRSSGRGSWDEAHPVPVVDGYDGLELIGRGGSSRVYRARRVEDGGEVVLKVAAPGWAESIAAEAETLAALRSEFVIERLGSARTRDGALVTVLPLVSGGSLAALIARRGHLLPGEVVTATTPVAQALAALHAAGLVHADLTPANVLITEQGKPVLADLGAACLSGAPDGHLVGTEGYIAPELRLGEAPSTASDVWAFGVMLHEALTGELPEDEWGRAPTTPGRAAETPGGGRGRARAGGSVRDRASDRGRGGPAEPTSGERLERHRLLRLSKDCLALEPEQRPDAATLASAVFAAATPLPIEGAGLDPSLEHALTHRIRRSAQESEARQCEDSSRWGGGALRGLVRRQDRGPMVRGGTAREGMARGRAGSGGSGRPQAPRVTILRMAAVAAAVGAAGGGLWGATTDGHASATVASEAQGHAGPTPGEGAATGAPSGQTSTASTTGATLTGASSASVSSASPPPNGSPASPSPTDSARAHVNRHPLDDTIARTVLQRLSDERATALTRAEPALLARVSAPGSAARTHDERVIAGLRSGGWRYEGLAITIDDVRVLTSDASGASVEARATTAAYRVVDRGGAVTTVAAPPPTRLRFTLTRTTTGWVLTSIA